MTAQDTIDHIIIPFNQALNAELTGGRWPLPPEQYGSWEGWLQVELSRYLDEQGVSFTREPAYPGTNQRADFSFEGFYYEMKCQIHGEPNQSFLTRIGKDQIKASNVHTAVIRLAYATPGVNIQQHRTAPIQLIQQGNEAFASFHYYIDTP